MKISNVIARVIILTAALMTIAGGAHAQPALERMPVPEFNEFYIASAVKLPLTKKVYIADAPVEFSEKWLKDFSHKAGANYQEQVKRKYGEALKQTLAKALKETGWDIVKSPEGNALSLQPKLTELNIYAPNGSSLKQVIVKNVGRAIMSVDVQTPDGETFMRVVDFRETQETIGSPIVANKTNNLRYFKLMMGEWSKDAVKYLDQIMVVAESQSKASGQ